MNDMKAIQFMGMLMSRQKLEIQYILELVEILNKSYFECQRVITILEDIYSREKSGKILLAVEILQYLVKNCNKNLHQAANKESFQKKIIGLLKRVRGKSSFLKDMRSNTDNWNKIEAKVLYLIQLWYDAFILEESVYNNIIDSYKLLRKENVMFPPRSTNQKNLLFVKTESPILQNIEEIARMDHQKFSKKLNSMGMEKASKKMELIEAEEVKRKATHKIDLDQISQKIAIVRSNQYEGGEMINLIQQVKRDLEFGRVDSSEEKYWKDIKEAAESLILQWQQKNVELIRQHQKNYLQAKLGKKVSEKSDKEKGKNPKKQEEQDETYEWQESIQPVKPKEQLNLLDL